MTPSVALQNLTTYGPPSLGYFYGFPPVPPRYPLYPPMDSNYPRPHSAPQARSTRRRPLMTMNVRQSNLLVITPSGKLVFLVAS